MSTTTQPEMAIVTVKKARLFACNLSANYGMFNYILNLHWRIAEWKISSQALKSAEYVNKRSLHQTFVCFPAKVVSRGSQMFVWFATSVVLTSGTWNARKHLSRQRKESSLTSGLKSGVMTTLRKGKLSLSRTITKGVTVIGNLCMPTTVASVSVAERKSSNSLPLIISTTTGASRGRRAFTLMVHSFTAILYSAISQAITDFFALTVILGERGTAVSAPIRKVQRLSRKRVQPSGWKRPLPYGVMI